MDRARQRAVTVLLLGLVAGAAWRAAARPAPPPGPSRSDACAEAAEEGLPAPRLLCAPSRARDAGGDDLGPEAALALGRRLDVCAATEAELRLLPGIGPARARAIVAHRESGGIESVEDLVRVPGIGPSTVARLAPLVRCRGDRPAD